MAQRSQQQPPSTNAGRGVSSTSGTQKRAQHALMECDQTSSGGGAAQTNPPPARSGGGYPRSGDDPASSKWRLAESNRAAGGNNPNMHVNVSSQRGGTGSFMFFSSVMKQGGVPTTSEADAQLQLVRSGAIKPTASNFGRNMARLRSVQNASRGDKSSLAAALQEKQEEELRLLQEAAAMEAKHPRGGIQYATDSTAWDYEVLRESAAARAEAVGQVPSLQAIAASSVLGGLAGTPLEARSDKAPLVEAPLSPEGGSVVFTKKKRGTSIMKRFREEEE